jgi:hypothetical protein
VLVVPGECRPGAVLEQLVRDRLDLDRALRRLGLRGFDPLSGERLLDPDPRFRRVGERDRPPPQAEDIAAADAGVDEQEKDDAGLLAPRTHDRTPGDPAAPVSAGAASLTRSSRDAVRGLKPVEPRYSAATAARIRSGVIGRSRTRTRIAA